MGERKKRAISGLIVLCLISTIIVIVVVSFTDPAPINSVGPERSDCAPFAPGAC